MSARVMKLLARYSAWVEVYSIDEEFLVVRGTLDELQVLGEKIKSEVMRLTGLPVCVGIARTKHDSCGKRTEPVDPSLG